MGLADPDDERAPVGRPRSAEADEAIAAAAMAVLAESGYDGVTVEAVAARAGVARSTVYRRYPGKPELLVTVLNHACQAPKEDVDTGSVVDDLTTVTTGLHRSLTGSEFGRAIPAIVAAATRHPAIAEALRTFTASRRATTLAAVRRGVERGELDPDVDPQMVVDLVVGPVFYRTFINPTPIDDRWFRELVERVLAGSTGAGSARERRAAGE